MGCRRRLSLRKPATRPACRTMPGEETKPNFLVLPARFFRKTIRPTQGRRYPKADKPPVSRAAVPAASIWGRLFEFDVVAGVDLVARSREQHRGGVLADIQHDSFAENLARQIVPVIVPRIAAESVHRILRILFSRHSLCR